MEGGVLEEEIVAGAKGIAEKGAKEKEVGDQRLASPRDMMAQDCPEGRRASALQIRTQFGPPQDQAGNISHLPILTSTRVQSYSCREGETATGCRMPVTMPSDGSRQGPVGSEEAVGSTHRDELCEPQFTYWKGDMGETASAGRGWDSHKQQVLDCPGVTVLGRANCSGPAMVHWLAAERCPLHPWVEWPIPVHEVVLPCTGRLQPEHLLNPFEAGAHARTPTACAPENCHCLEGSRRAERRAVLAWRWAGHFHGEGRDVFLTLPPLARTVRSRRGGR